MTTAETTPTLTERLTAALLHATHPDGRPAHVPELIVTEALVPALLAELLPAPDGRSSADDVPYWQQLAMVSPLVAVWPDGVHRDGFVTDAKDITPAEVERSGLALLAVAAEMRRHDAWNGR